MKIHFWLAILILGVMVRSAISDEVVSSQPLRYVPMDESLPNPLQTQNTQLLSRPDLPGGEQVAQWMDFSRPVKLEMTVQVGSEDRGDYRKWGKLIEFYSYQAPQDSLVSYGIALYERGTLWGEHRQEMIDGVEKAVAEADQQPAASKDDWKRTYHIEDRSGRRIYFSLMGFGPGGAAQCGFTFLPKYDLLVTQMDDFQDDVPDEKRIKDPAKPRNDLSMLMLKTEEYLLNGTQ